MAETVAWDRAGHGLYRREGRADELSEREEKPAGRIAKEGETWSDGVFGTSKAVVIGAQSRLFGSWRRRNGNELKTKEHEEGKTKEAVFAHQNTGAMRSPLRLRFCAKKLQPRALHRAVVGAVTTSSLCATSCYTGFYYARGAMRGVFREERVRKVAATASAGPSCGFKRALPAVGLDSLLAQAGASSESPAAASASEFWIGIHASSSDDNPPTACRCALVADNSRLGRGLPLLVADISSLHVFLGVVISPSIDPSPLFPSYDVHPSLPPFPLLFRQRLTVTLANPVHTARAVAPPWLPTARAHVACAVATPAPDRRIPSLLLLAYGTGGADVLVSRTSRARLPIYGAEMNDRPWATGAGAGAGAGADVATEADVDVGAVAAEEDGNEWGRDDAYVCATGRGVCEWVWRCGGGCKGPERHNVARCECAERRADVPDEDVADEFAHGVSPCEAGDRPAALCFPLAAARDAFGHASRRFNGSGAKDIQRRTHRTRTQPALGWLGRHLTCITLGLLLVAARSSVLVAFMCTLWWEVVPSNGICCFFMTPACMCGGDERESQTSIKKGDDDGRRHHLLSTILLLSVVPLLSYWISIDVKRGPPGLLLLHRIPQPSLP
ncbi:hypothetical protein B0H16DRAFT_1695863 [Mycena metata]|uniref:Uncharacterized protein n=1 Tax=Mycena metata TaxID=1033252 RepID=A0AAD7I5J3_9AGAR|nr:hypothetical protein B0H16DRAFT_1695863 [Mycena metata]